MCLSITFGIKFGNSGKPADVKRVTLKGYPLDFFIISNVFINSHGCLKLIIYMLNHLVKELYLGIDLVPCLVS